MQCRHAATLSRTPAGRWSAGVGYHPTRHRCSWEKFASGSRVDLIPLGRAQRSHDRLRHNCKSSIGSDASDHRLIRGNSIDDGPAGSRRASAGTAFAIDRRDRKCPADPAQQFEALPVCLCPSPDSGLWGGPSVRVFVGGHRQLARRRVTNEKNVARGVIRHQRPSALMMRPLMALRASYSSIARSRSSRLGGQALRVRDRLFPAAIPCATQTTRVIETGVRDRVTARRAAARRSRFKRLSQGSPKREMLRAF